MSDRCYTRVKPVLFGRVSFVVAETGALQSAPNTPLRESKQTSTPFVWGGAGHLALSIIYRSCSGVTVHLLLHVCGGARGS